MSNNKNSITRYNIIINADVPVSYTTEATLNGKLSVKPVNDRKNVRNAAMQAVITTYFTTLENGRIRQICHKA